MKSATLAEQEEQSTLHKVCRFCRSTLGEPFLDLGCTPLANSYISQEKFHEEEASYPLRVFVCESCFLVQLCDFLKAKEIFTDYAYFSSYSESWLAHAKAYVESVSERFQLGPEHRVIELASNDGYLLQYFVEKKIPVLGIEPAGNVAQAAIQKGIPTLVKFFGEKTAWELARKEVLADLLIANNVLAHVPDLNDFVAGIKRVLKKEGIATLEFPHLMRLIEDNQFDTIYHEHFSYFTCTTVDKILNAHGLRLFDVEEISTHGGSLRIYACHIQNENLAVGERVIKLKEREGLMGLNDLNVYRNFSKKVERVKKNLVSFLTHLKSEGKTVAAYGAPAKGNTLLNFCGIKPDLIPFTVDVSPHKQNHYLPGSRIPVDHPDKIREQKPGYVLILPWNLKEEISERMKSIRDWNGKFVVPIPDLTIF